MTRAARSLLALILLAAIISACATPAAPTTAPAQPPTEAVAEATAEPTAALTEAGPASGGTLVFVAGGAPENMDPATTYGNWDARVMRSIFDTMIYVDREKKMHPGLALSWEQSADAKTFTLKLRQGVKFHDGTPFNAEAAKYNFDRFGNPEVGTGTMSQYFTGYKGTEVLDEYTVRVTFDTPKSVFMYCLGDPFASIASPAAIEKWGKDAGQHPVGTGPFMMTEWVPGESITLVRNPDYQWAPEIFKHQGPAYLDSVVFRTVAEDQTRLAVLKNGEAGVAMGVPPFALDELLQDPAFYTIPSVPPGDTSQQMLNAAKPPTDELAVRKAMIYATDQETLAATVSGKTREASHSALARTTLDFDQAAEDMYRYDPEKAKSLLEEAGWVDTDGDGIREKNGNKLQVYWPAYTGEKTFAELLMSMWKEVGIDTRFEALDDAAAWEAAGAGQHNVTNMASINFDASILYPLFHSSNSQGYAFCNFRDDKLDEALTKALNAANDQERSENYALAQRIIMEQALIVPLTTLDSTVAARSEFADLSLDWEDYYLYFYDVYVKK